MTHYVEAGGAFETSMHKLIADGFSLPYFTQPRPAAEKKKDLSKVKFTCSCCGAKAWAKVGTRIICADCDEEMQGEL
jgi:uncharacterized membrane protein